MATDKKKDLFTALQDEPNGALHYKSLGYRFIHKLLSGIDPDSESAYILCRDFESAYLIRDEAFTNNFPVGVHKPETDENAQDRTRLRKRITSLGTALEGDGLTQKTWQRKKQELAEAKEELKKITASKPKKIYASDEHNSKRKKPKARPQDWKFLLKWTDEQAKKFAQETPDLLYTNLSLLFDTISKQHANSDNPELIKNLLFLLLTYEESPFFEHFVDNFANDLESSHMLLARMLGLDDSKAISELLGPNSSLVQYGIIEPHKLPSGASYDPPKISSYLRKILSQPNLTLDKILSELSGAKLTTHLDWEKDFGGLGPNGERMEKLIRHSQEMKRLGKTHAGPVVFFTGMPDTGKTSAIAALGKHLGMDVRVIGENLQFRNSNQNDDASKMQELTPLDRLSQIMMSLAIAGDNPNTIFLIEEPDSLLPMGRGSGKDSDIKDPIDRVVIQRLFENHPATALFFTTNHWDIIHPSVRRRTAMQFQMNTPNREQRQEIIRRIIQQHNERVTDGEARIQLSDENIATLAATYIAPAGKWATAIPNAIITSEGNPDSLMKEIVFFLEAQARRDYGSVTAIKATHVPTEYNYNLANTTIRGGNTLEGFTQELIQEVKHSHQPAFRLLLDGWPGTGKSEYVWHIADQLNKDVIYVRASDLLNMFVGGTEQNIAAYFQEAKDRGAILLIDEVDSIIRSRSQAHRSWEVTQVNEFLSQLEHYDGMIAVTTNNISDIDSAAFRRFKHPITFDFLKPEQRIEAYKMFLGTEPPAFVQNRLDALHKLTPADFGLVREDAMLSHFQNNPERLIHALEELDKKKPKEHMPKWRSAAELGFAHRYQTSANGKSAERAA